MGTVHSFQPEKLAAGLLWTNAADRSWALSLLERSFGEIDYAGPDMLFSFTSYYDQELGTPIYRSLVSFRELVDPADLASIKLETNELETVMTVAGRRRVNIDPGLLTLSRFSLATTKENSHRIPLRHGIFAEITLLYHRGGYEPLPWTYPDYRSKEYHEILLEIRSRLKQQLIPAGNRG
ncbi:MAG: DUF4416 family protein [Spirochaetales bacterium]|nr:DUF4416 family protein [Spirochaetales bacterium]MCF7937372.1 DUF4416 family protein [Spirochaetales bacterium]